MGDPGGEMLPIKLMEDLTGTPLRLPGTGADAVASAAEPGVARTAAEG
jgi:hypothetical protein